MSETKPQQLVVDYGREYCTADFVESHRRRGIEVVYRSPASPFNKGAVERAMRAAQAPTRQAKA